MVIRILLLVLMVSLGRQEICEEKKRNSFRLNRLQETNRFDAAFRMHFPTTSGLDTLQKYCVTTDDVTPLAEAFSLSPDRLWSRLESGLAVRSPLSPAYLSRDLVKRTAEQQKSTSKGHFLYFRVQKRTFLLEGVL